MHRPLRDGRPWSFGLKGICDEALHDTDGQCVAYQLAAVLRTRKGETPFDLAEVETMLDTIVQRLYPRGDPESPYETDGRKGLEHAPWREVGITAACIVELCKTAGPCPRVLESLPYRDLDAAHCSLRLCGPLR